MKRVYIIGSLRNPRVSEVAIEIRAAGFNVFDDWMAAGKIADDCWQAYETARGHSYIEALQGHAAQHVFAFDKQHLLEADAVVLVTPAGKSGHLELGWSLGRGVPGFILMEQEPDRWDVMLQFATAVVPTVNELIDQMDYELDKDNVWPF